MKPVWPPVALIVVPGEEARRLHGGTSLEQCRREILAANRRLEKGLQRGRESARVLAWMEQARELARKLASSGLARTLEISSGMLEQWYETAARSEVRPPSMFVSAEALRARLQTVCPGATFEIAELAQELERAAEQDALVVEVVG